MQKLNGFKLLSMESNFLRRLFAEFLIYWAELSVPL